MREGGGIPVDCAQSNFSSSFCSLLGHSYASEFAYAIFFFVILLVIAVTDFVHMIIVFNAVAIFHAFIGFT